MEFIVGNKISKVERYGWTIKDACPDLVWINKKLLKVDLSYQRELAMSKVLAMASAWSWMACGTIQVVARGKEYFVYDGSHRWAAAMRRTDIPELPCAVFVADSVQQEAEGFLAANVGRGPVSAIDKFRASRVAGNPNALWVAEKLARYAVVLKKSPKFALEAKCIDAFLRAASIDQDTFETVLNICCRLSESDEVPISETLFGGLLYLHRNASCPLDNEPMTSRVLKAGAIRLVRGAKRYAAAYIKGGNKAWAMGMMEEINKGCRNKVGFKSMD